ncbi:septum formation inhibitor Maf [Algibacter sp. 2305UL17-15]|uniref:septum formation inhibitor Maf n=1 Tax=Algibacter sp. 2305UL17-15 TaxID=3231268 RepID=UPI00345ACBF5
MKSILKTSVLYLSFIAVLSMFTACKNETHPEQKLAVNTSNTVQKTAEPLSQEFKDYWYAGEAEISSYKLEQARYSEMREGTAVLIYVTEDFLPEVQVKADHQNAKNIPVLKLNATKNFNTGIYPYSIMQSTFYPVTNNQHALKVSSSIQEWCGHVYAQLNNREKFEIMSHSYFEGEADEHFKLEKTILENELWTQLRINPKSLPIGDLKIIPSFEFTRLKHKPIKAYNAKADLNKDNYTISYPGLNRKLSINFNPNFPHEILGWEETFTSGPKILTTKATKLKTIKSPYWQKNHNKDAILRETLQLN